MGWRPADQFCAGTEARSRSRDTGQRVRHDGRRTCTPTKAPSIPEPSTLDANSTGGSIPKATRIVLRAPWKKVTITPIDISVKTRFTTE